MSSKKIILINTILFFCGWTVILLAGADSPPPIGFLYLIPLIAILDFVQYKYLQYFLPQLIERKKGLFVKNAATFAIGGMVVSILCLITRFSITIEMNLSDIITWIIVLMLTGVIYSVVFWFFNVLLLKLIKSK